MLATKCVWLNEDDANEWMTSCGNTIADEETDGKWKFCPWCGREMMTLAKINSAQQSATRSTHEPDTAQIKPGYYAYIECSNRECDWRDPRFGVCTHFDGKCLNHIVLNPA